MCIGNFKIPEKHQGLQDVAKNVIDGDGSYQKTENGTEEKKDSLTKALVNKNLFGHLQHYSHNCSSNWIAYPGFAALVMGFSDMALIINSGQLKWKNVP